MFGQHFFNTMSTFARKYRLEELLNALPRGVTVGTVNQMLLDHYGISTPTFLRHRQIPLDSPSEMNVSALKAYSEFFNVSMEDLLTPSDEPKKASRSVYDLLNVPQSIKIAAIASLAGMVAPQ